MKEKKYLKLRDKELFISYLLKGNLLKEVNKKNEVLLVNDYEDNMIEIQYEDVNALYTISLYILGNIIKEYTKSEKDKTLIKGMKEVLLMNKYYSAVISLEMDRYFLSRDVLIEENFIKFNLTGLNEEIELIKENLLMEIDGEKLKEEMYETYKKKLNILDYEELRVKYIDGELNLINKKKESLNSNNIEEILGVQFKRDEFDEWTYDLSFCSIICTILKIKKLIIPKEYKELYEDLVETEGLITGGTKIILE